MAAAQNDLLRLHKELDLSDPARPELEVSRYILEGCVTGLGVDHILDRVDVGNRPII